MLDTLTANMLDVLVETGELDEALEGAAGLGTRLEASRHVWARSGSRAAEARILAFRGQTGLVAAVIDWLEPLVRGTEEPHVVVNGLGSSALARARLGQDEAATALLAEVEAYPDARETLYYSAFLPAMVRTALGMGDRILAERLASGLEPRYPMAEHAVVAANAALVEARGDLQAAADAFAHAAGRWERFGVVPEQAFALLGQGRCLMGLSRRTDAAPVLREARQIFDRLGAAPTLTEIDVLLQEETAPPPTSTGCSSRSAPSTF
jgi:hypothetical protein